MREKTRPFLFLNVDYKAVQRWLEREAEAGWELTEVRSGWGAAVFRQTHREDLCYCVDLTSGRDDPDYLRLCADAGWLRVARAGNMNLFKSAPGRSPAPLQTDRDLEREHFGKVLFGGKRALWLLLPLLLAYLVFEAFLFAEDGVWPHDFAFSSLWQVFLLQVGVLVVLAGCLLYPAAYWRRARRRAAAGEGMPVPSPLGARVRGTLIWVLCGLYLAMALLSGFGHLSDRDAFEIDGFRFRTETTLFGTRARASDSVDHSGWVLVDAFDCRFPWLADLVVRDLLAEEGRSPEPMGHLHGGGLDMEPAELGFDAAWVKNAPPAFPGGEPVQCLVVRQGNRVLRLCGDWAFTGTDSLARIREGLSQPIKT